MDESRVEVDLGALRELRTDLAVIASDVEAVGTFVAGMVVADRHSVPDVTCDALADALDRSRSAWGRLMDVCPESGVDA